MQKEFLTNSIIKYTLNIVAGEVESCRKNVETTNTLRLYDDNGHVGIAGSYGKADWQILENKANENLQDNTPYPCKLPSNVISHVDVRKQIISDTEIISKVNSTLSLVKQRCPDFIFGNKVYFYDYFGTYRNTLNCDMSYKTNAYSYSIIAKHKDSANIFDAVIGFITNDYDEDKIINEFVRSTEKFSTPCELKECKQRVLFNGQEFFALLASNLAVQTYASGSSIFKDGLGKQIFNDKLNVSFDRTPGKAYITPQFDCEGHIATDYNEPFITNGVLNALLGNKKQGEQYNLAVAQNSNAEYDSIPEPSLDEIDFHCPNTPIAELTKEPVIYVVISSGGDITSTGEFATPVQLAYLIKDGEFIGKLPDMKISGNVMDILGKDFISIVRDEKFSLSLPQMLLVQMNVSK